MKYRPEDLIQPSPIKHDDEPKRKDIEAERRIALRFEASLMSARLGLEIQAKCGLFPLSAGRKESLKGHRSLATNRAAKRVRKEVPSQAWKVLDDAYAELLLKTPCSHCAARSDCPAVNALLLH